MGAPRIDKLDKNYIINGNFDFWQRATGSTFSGTGGPISGYAWADRFQFSVQSTNNRANRAVNRSTDVPTFAESGFRSTYSMEYSQTSALTLVGTDYLTWCQQLIEGIFYRNLHGKTITLSFWFKSTLAGQYPAGFRNNLGNRSYVTLFTYDVANVWQKIYITLPTDSSGTWEFGSATGMRVDIASDSVSGSIYEAPSLNTWSTGNYFSTSSGVQVQSQTNITIKVAQLQLVEGDIQTESFSMAGRDYADEFNLCQRYYEITGVGAETSLASGSQSGIGFAPWRVVKRATPVVDIQGNSVSNSLRNQNTGATVSGLNLGPSIYGTEVRFSGAQADNVLFAGTVFADAEL